MAKRKLKDERLPDPTFALCPLPFALCPLPFAINMSLCPQSDDCDFSKLSLRRNHRSGGAARWSFFTPFR
jgi:hypothetical protein